LAVRHLETEDAGEALRIERRPAEGAKLPPAISGFELVLE